MVMNLLGGIRALVDILAYPLKNFTEHALCPVFPSNLSELVIQVAVFNLYWMYSPLVFV